MKERNKALSADGNPSLATVLKLSKALGVHFDSVACTPACAGPEEHNRERVNYPNVIGCERFPHAA